MLENVFGYIGGVLSSGAMLPQWIRMIRTQSTQDISWAMLCMSLSGQVLWIVHGAIQHDPVIILFCCITLGLNTGVMTTKCLHSYRTSGGMITYLSFQNKCDPLELQVQVQVQEATAETSPALHRSGMSRTHSHNLGV